MEPVIIAAIIGAVATILSSVGTRLILRKYFPERYILPTRRRETDVVGEPYSNLAGTWYEYHLTRDQSLGQTPFWARHEEQLDIQEGQFVSGRSINLGHPARLQYSIKGEIRHGKMLLTYDCMQDPTEFVTIIYPDLLNRESLIGAWMGFDYQRNPAGGPIILSRQQRTTEELNQLLRSGQPPSFIPAGDYPEQPRPRT